MRVAGRARYVREGNVEQSQQPPGAYDLLNVKERPDAASRRDAKPAAKLGGAQAEL
jgi:hypothetical protein